jgi:solute carrier family 25 folate transporter 32
MAGNERRTLPPYMHLLAGLSTGMIVALLTNPIWVVKTRMQTQMFEHQRSYKGFFHGIYKLWKDEGIGGYYKGIVPALLGVSHGAMQFMAYEEVKRVWTKYQIRTRGQSDMGSIHFMAMACLSKLFASVTTYPFQVIKSRLQVRPSQFSGSWDCVRWTYAHQGFTGFYAGFVPNVFKVMPAAIITFVAYENFAAWLGIEAFESGR